MIKPLNNHCLIEVINDYEGVVGSTGGQMQKGILRDFTLTRDHLTASAGHGIEYLDDYKTDLDKKLGKVVYWEEYSDMGKQFTIDGKQYVLIAFYRIIGYEE